MRCVRRREASPRSNRIATLTAIRDDWAARVEQNGKVSGVFTDYHYYGTGDIGGAPDEESVKRLEAIVTKGTASLPPQDEDGSYIEGQAHPEWPAVKVGDGPVHVISANAEQMFLDITPSEAAGLPRYTGEMELTNHSAGSLTSQAYQKRWLRKEELLADAAEKASVAAEWLGARPYPLQRLNDAWTLVMGGQFHDIAAGTATPKSYEFAWNDDVIAMNQFAGVLTNATEAVAAALDTETKGIPHRGLQSLEHRARRRGGSQHRTSRAACRAAVHVIGPDGKEVPAQISNGKVLFVAKVPSVGYAVYDVQPGPRRGRRIRAAGVARIRWRISTIASAECQTATSPAFSTSRSARNCWPRRRALRSPTIIPSSGRPGTWTGTRSRPRRRPTSAARRRFAWWKTVRCAWRWKFRAKPQAPRFVQTIRLSAGDAGKRVEIRQTSSTGTPRSPT